MPPPTADSDGGSKCRSARTSKPLGGFFGFFLLVWGFFLVCFTSTQISFICFASTQTEKLVPSYTGGS